MFYILGQVTANKVGIAIAFTSETGAENSDEALDAHLGGLLCALGRRVQVGDGSVGGAPPVATHAGVDGRANFLLHHARYHKFVGSIQGHQLLGGHFANDVDPLGHLSLVPHHFLEHLLGHLGSNSFNVVLGERVVLLHFFNLGHTNLI